MSTLAGFVIAYLAVSVAIGVYAARRVRSTGDYVLAGRSLPLPVVVATVFATWYGAETVLGVSATFMKEGLRGVAADPFGASLALVIIGLVFAARLYRLNLLTIGDYFRTRFDRRSEVLLSVCIVIGYLGWTAAQFIALGVVLSVVSQGAVAPTQGMVIGAGVVLGYTLFGGMWSVALTDFFQMIVIVAGMLYIGWVAADMAGGVGTVVSHAAEAGQFAFWPEGGARDWLWFVAATLPLLLGSVPQQDTYQRVMSARNVETAIRGAIIGGLLYFAFAFVPMFLVYSAKLVDPALTASLIDADHQMILPRLVLDHMPVVAQVMFFGALLSAIMSSASGALLAPSTLFAENALKPLVGRLADRQMLWATRMTVACFAMLVLAFAANSGSTIFEMVEKAYSVTLVSAFVPLVAGLFWRRANARGALSSAIAGVATWLALEAFAPDGFWPPQLAGLLASAIGMALGSLAPPARHPLPR